MKQVLQNISNGLTSIEDVPHPKPIDDHVLISSSKSLVSSGTEKMLMDFGKASYFDKARQQPEKVKMVIDKVKTDGVMTAIETVKSKLDQPIPLGYCNAGVILDPTNTQFEIGERVVSNGFHAEIVRVPKNLCVRIPDSVDDDTAAFTVLGSISLQGIRLINPTLGEAVVVYGLGLVGLLAVQILIANGCRVLGVDFDSERCKLARNYGAQVVDLSKGEDLIKKSKSFSRNRGVDAVLIAASTKSHELMHYAAEICRKRARIVLVGQTGLNLRRDDFFKKEISFQVSASYGPGRYDPLYEEKGQDYPIGFVRWTEQRNFEAVLDMMANRTIEVKSLISHQFKISEAKKAYDVLDSENSLGILIDYSKKDKPSKKENNEIVLKKIDKDSINKNNAIIGFIGSGNYASRTLIPLFKKTSATLKTIISSGGISGAFFGNKFNFGKTSTDENLVWNDDNINTVVIATRHNLHSEQIIKGLNKNMNVFVEKPLALNHKSIDSIVDAFGKSKSKLMVGYNRRFAPHITKIKELIEKKEIPKTFIMTMNAGYIPSDHWVHDEKIGGGRVIGEACHYIDLMRFLAGSKIKSFSANKIGKNISGEVTEDICSISLSFEDGSMGTIHYFANGGNSFPKERIEVFCDGGILQLNNFRVLNGFNWDGFSRMRLFSQDKGQKNCINSFIRSINDGEESPIPMDEIFEIARVSVDIAEMLRNNN